MVIFYIFIAYFIGSIPTGKIVGLANGVDLQKKGSGNIGFANAVRVLGWRLGAVVLVGDIAKGFIAIAIPYGLLSSAELALVAGAVILGNVFPIWLRFRGGKGVATGFGALLGLSLPVALGSACCYVVGVLLTRKSAAGSLAAALALPLLAILFKPDLVYFCLLLTVFAFFTHRSNIRQMLREKPDRKASRRGTTG